MFGVGPSQVLEPLAHEADAGIARVAIARTTCAGVRRCGNHTQILGFNSQ